MTGRRLADYLDHIRRAADEACGFVDGLGKDAFLADRRTQRAVVMSIVIIGEAATQVMERYPSFAARHPEVRWRDMRGMRNRLAHGYFEIDLDLVWQTVRTALPELLAQLPDQPDDGPEATPG